MKDLTTGTVTDVVFAGALRVSKIQGGVNYYYHLDRLGSVRLVTKTANLQTFSVKYQPYGTGYATSGAESFQYTGKQLDVATGLYYYGYRYYDTQTGRFISPDPAGSNYLNPQSLNRYVYALNNPMANTDPTGALSRFYYAEIEAEGMGIGINWTQNQWIGWFKNLSNGLSTDQSSSTQPFTPNPSGQGTPYGINYSNIPPTGGGATLNAINAAGFANTPNGINYSGNPTTGTVLHYHVTTLPETLYYKTTTPSQVPSRLWPKTPNDPQAAEMWGHIAVGSVEIVWEFRVSPAPMLEIIICKSVVASGTPACPDQTIY